MILTIDQARALAEAAMVAVGHTRLEANIIADHLVDCELRGLPFGGLARALSIAERIEATTTPRRPITVTKETPVSVLIVGGDQVGYLVAHRATEMALEKARSTGLAVVGAHETYYAGNIRTISKQSRRPDSSA
jgi:LDH2 family malate/lactate/ureidoglycolate dehydrogenase